MPYQEQTLVSTQRRLVKKYQLSAQTTAITSGITGSAFCNGATAGGANDVFYQMTVGITANTAKLSGIKSSCNARYLLSYEGTPGVTAFDSGGAGNIDFTFERFTIPNTATTPTGNIIITPSTATGTIILEFVL